MFFLYLDSSLHQDIYGVWEVVDRDCSEVKVRWIRKKPVLFRHGKIRIHIAMNINDNDLFDTGMVNVRGIPYLSYFQISELV